MIDFTKLLNCFLGFILREIVVFIPQGHARVAI
jgi:hypothetical protein